MVRSRPHKRSVKCQECKSYKRLEIAVKSPTRLHTAGLRFLSGARSLLIISSLFFTARKCFVGLVWAHSLHLVRNLFKSILWLLLHFCIDESQKETRRLFQRRRELPVGLWKTVTPLRNTSNTLPCSHWCQFLKVCHVQNLPLRKHIKAQICD